MPVLRTRRQQPNPVTPQVPIPGQFPPIPQEVLDRFPSAKGWQEKLDEFWGRTQQALQEAQRQTAAQVNSQVIWTVDRFLIYTNNGGAMPMFALDDTGVRLGNVLVINTPGRKVYIGAGEYANDNTPFYIDTDGNFSLGASLTWNPDTDTLAITGTITATSGTIGGFDIGADYIRDTANSMGLASTVTAGDDVRFWAGNTFANRALAPFNVTESGILTATNAAVIVGTVSGRLTATLAAAINAAGNLITDVVNPRLDSSSKYILSDFNFGATDYAGAVKSGTITWNTGTGAITGGSGVVVYRGGIVGANAGVATFTIDAATGAATFAGALAAPTGNIGGWTINPTTLAGGNATLDSVGQLILGTVNDVVVLSAADATYRLWIGNATAASASFSVTKAGVLSATGATISGAITATSGMIGGFSVGSDYIRDSANSSGMASTVTGGDDTRFWAGDTFANRASAPFHVFESGAVYITNLTVATNSYLSNLIIKVNQINENVTAGTAQVEINRDGYLGGTSYFRDFVVYDGKSAVVATFTGSTKALALVGAFSASNFSGTFSGSSSGTNTGDQSLPTRASLGLATSDDVTFNTVNVGTGGYKVSGTKVLGAQASAEADASINATITGSETLDSSVVGQNFYNLQYTLNSLLQKLRTHGIIAT